MQDFTPFVLILYNKIHSVSVASVEQLKLHVLIVFL